MARKKSKFVEQVEDINLIPIMNLVLCLIPLVLFKTQLVKIGMVNVSAPKVGPASTKPQEEDKDKKPLGLTVALSKDGFLLKATGADLSTVFEGQGDASGVKIPMKSDEYSNKGGDVEKVTTYNYIELYKKLLTLREMYEDDKLLTLTAEPELEFKYLIRTMDIVRYQFADDVKMNTIAELSEAANNSKYKKVEEEGDEDGDAQATSTYKALWDQVTFAIVQ
jgi:hypothetical protein